ncbi:hypothetical protein P167DRAFT_549510 [Morchella conica CCBAS932]|uniref:Uncharacterized protein n=1 Tax=Morchella conica CCBAS932 TaxID=1392247 RepID=A0A3N4KB48_9PEZI|nr:hypothetical protein P167DRAFT_549510 [Morchella conica CCBAS932]
MRTYTTLPLLFFFSAIMIGSATSKAIVPRQLPEDEALEAEIAKLHNITRISKLPPATIYTFEHQFLNPTTGETETIVLHPTAGELLAGFDTPTLAANKKRAEPEFGVVCETSRGSPDAFDVVKAMVTMNSQEREFCCQWQPFGSRCHTMETHKTGAVGICGPFMRCVPCLHTIDFILIMVDKCRAKFPGGKTLVGGKFNLGRYGEAPPYGGYLLAYHT